MGRTADWLARSMTCPSATRYLTHETALYRDIAEHLQILLQVQHQLSALCINATQETAHNGANLDVFAILACLLISKAPSC